MNVLKNYINGKFVASKSTENINIMNPAKDEVIALKPNSTQEEIDEISAFHRGLWIDSIFLIEFVKTSSTNM